MTHLEQWAAAEQRARDLITFADGIEAAGMTEYAQRARVVARDALDLVRQLRQEHSARLAMQEQRDLARDLLQNRQGGQRAA